MAEIVNLRRVRKQKAREEDAARADANRARFGVKKPERQQREAEEDRAARAHEGHKIEKE
jgi:hypothetical protein